MTDGEVGIAIFVGLTAGAILTVAIVFGGMEAYPRESFEHEAIKHGAAKYCIEDNEKVFRWGGCDHDN